MEDITIGKGSVSIWSLVAITGGFVAFISVFLTISSPDHLFNLTGIDMLTNKMDGEDAGKHFYTFWRFMPFITALLGLAVMILSALPIFGIDKPGIKMAAFIVGIVTLVFGIFVIACSAGSAGFDFDTAHVKFYREIGAYFALYGGIMAAVFGFLNWKGIKF